MTLAELVRRAVARDPDAVAIAAPDATVSYRSLDAAADRCAAGLHALGVRRGDRVAVWAEKGAAVVAAMQGALRIGAAYVPIDPQSPPLRARQLCTDCAVAAAVTTPSRADDLADAAPRALLLDVPTGPVAVTASGAAAGAGTIAWSELPSLPPAPRVDPSEGDLAYVLYTSGSTGRPKGVCISHANALAFVEWAARELRLSSEDRLANHAPFHFDLSVLDLYGAFYAGARACLVPEGAAYAPRRLVDFLVGERITVWYSVPSALVLMMEHGGLLAEAAPSLRALLFAGEVFPVKHLRRLRARWPSVRFLNLYGPTETNVCTFHEVGALDDDRSVPIGRACSGDRVWLRGDGADPEEGELMVDGPTVMLGYWGHPPQEGAYPTGDVVRRNAAGELVYVGRRDHMVKIRGHRIELGEVEAALLAHPALREVAVAVAGGGVEARLVAFAAAAGARRPSLLALKEHCARRLPRAMIIDEVRWVEALPRTGNGKVDRVALVERAQSPLFKGEPSCW